MPRGSLNGFLSVPTGNFSDISYKPDSTNIFISLFVVSKKNINSKMSNNVKKIYPRLLHKLYVTFNCHFRLQE